MQSDESVSTPITGPRRFMVTAGCQCGSPRQTLPGQERMCQHAWAEGLKSQVPGQEHQETAPGEGQGVRAGGGAFASFLSWPQNIPSKERTKRGPTFTKPSPPLQPATTSLLSEFTYTDPLPTLVHIRISWELILKGPGSSLTHKALNRNQVECGQNKYIFLNATKWSLNRPKLENNWSTWQNLSLDSILEDILLSLLN